jgi:hypothetical protein
MRSAVNKRVLVIERSWRQGRARRRSFLAAVLTGLLTMALVGGCAEEKKKGEAAAVFEIEKEYKRGPVTFTQKVSKKEITIADRLQLVLEVRAQEDYEVRLPEFGEKLEQFGIVDYHAEPPTLTTDGLVKMGKTYVLEPFLSGDYIIPAMKVVFQKPGEEQGHEIESEPVTITVKSLLPADGADQTIREIAPPVALPGSNKIWLYGLAGIALCFGVGTAVFLVLRRRRTLRATVSRRSAHGIAYEELKRLLAEKLVEQGAVKDFYLRLSHILRHYIEDRFGLHAPERTTEEFLLDLGSTQALIPHHKELLKEFLNHCDMVKFAEHQPSTMEIQQTFDSCKQFIVETEIRVPGNEKVGRKVSAEEGGHAL